MNCKSGDMAIAVSDALVLMSDGPFEGQWATAPLSGKVVRVATVRFNELDGALWRLDEPLRCNYEHHGTLMYGSICDLPDSILRPLPPLSEDEYDQAELTKA